MPCQACRSAASNSGLREPPNPSVPYPPPHAASDAPDSRTRQAAKATVRRGAGRLRWTLAARTPRTRAPTTSASAFDEVLFGIRAMLTGRAAISGVFKCTKIGPLTHA